MRRGTTPTLRVSVDGLDLKLLETIYITLDQGHYQITKSGEDLEIDYDSGLIKLLLSQEETLNFKAGKNIKLQLRGITSGDIAVASEIKNIYIDDILLESVISNTESNKYEEGEEDEPTADTPEGNN